ncbi:MAG: methyltransferase [Candidatus Marinimicrobia bacterium]|nr:methyltransferase [Candidatus Neomarinimicrobiota bacterium]
MIYIYKDKKFNIMRYPRTSNTSLRSWNASDEYLLNFIEDLPLGDKQILIYNDRFGFLANLLYDYHPFNVCSYKSQEKAIIKNLENNRLSLDHLQLLDLFAYPGKKTDLALIKVPKSMGLFRFYLQHLSKSIKKTGMVLCGFMTRHFTGQMLQIAAEYFDEVEQNLAWKKARLLILKKPKNYLQRDLLENCEVNSDLVLKQYPGVFSSGTMDAASRFLMDTVSVQVKDKVILDLGCGNGVLAKLLHDDNSKAEMHLIDDFSLAVASAKLNISGKKVFFHYDDNLKSFDNNFFNLVISNPPFHFEHENNIEVTLDLFKHVARVLKDTGRFIIVANRHLNYSTHLEKYFNQIDILAENDKYVIYESKNIFEEEEILEDDTRFNV